MEQRTEISQDKVLSPGDLVDLHFQTYGMAWLTAAQIAAIENRFARQTHWKIISHSLPLNNRVIFRVQVLKVNPVFITVGVIAAAIMGVGFIAWLTLDKAFQIIDTPAGKIGFAGMGAAGIAAAFAVIASLLSGKR